MNAQGLFLRRLLPVALALVLPGGAAVADDASFSADRFELLPGAFDVLTVMGATVPAGLDLRAAAGVQLASGLLRLDGGTTEADLIGSSFAAQLSGALALGGRFEVGAVLPVALVRDTASGGVLPAAATGGLGDLRVLPKVVLPSWRSVRFAAALPVTLPIGRRGALLGEGSLTAAPSGVAETNLGPVRAVANLGLVVRPRRQFYDLTVGSAVTYGVAAEYPFRARGWGWAASAAAWGEIGLLDGGTGARPAELDAALRWEGPFGVQVTGLLGRGLVAGYGAPALRVLLLAGWRPGGGESGGESAPPVPVAPPAPQVEGASGSPPPPPTPPPPTVEGAAMDECAPRQPHAPEACPAADDDGDGFPNAEDRCPLLSGMEAYGGCPPPKAVLKDQRIELNEAIFFDPDSASIQPRSFQLLDDIARILEDKPQVKQVSIEGHTDATGDRERNQALSEQRASAVKDYLATRGVAAERLDAKGFGQDRPIADNETSAGRGRNRRVEFLVKDQAGALPPAPGPGSAR